MCPLRGLDGFVHPPDHIYRLAKTPPAIRAERFFFFFSGKAFRVTPARRPHRWMATGSSETRNLRFEHG
jgi:hypothetical protein